MTKFKYNNRIYNPSDLDKKLKKLGITRSDIEIIEDTIIKDNDNDNEDNGITKHHFILPNGYTVTSIYDNLDNLGITDYKQID